MKAAGEVTSHLGCKLLIVKSDAGQLPPLYAKIADKDSNPVGKIVDLYGSVAHPYITILCEPDAASSVSDGDVVYVIPEEKQDKARKFRKGFKRKESWKQK